MLGFGEFFKSLHLFTTKNQDQLKMVPINNLDGKRNNGFINYKLKICDAKHLNASSMTQVKVMLNYSIELKPNGEYKMLC